MSVYVRQSFCYKWYLNIWDKWSSIYFEYYTTVLILNFPYDLELTRASHIPHSVINYFLEIRSSLVAGIGAGVGISLISFVWRVSGGGLAALEQRGLLVLSPARNTQNIKHLHISPMYPMKTTISTTLLTTTTHRSVWSGCTRTTRPPRPLSR